jgi:glucan 1,3-beta-glucosidase
VFRNVRDYGAQGNGEHDDTQAFIDAANSGIRCMENCAGTSIHGATVFVPPGRYLIRRSVMLPVYTQLVGDPDDRPVLIRGQRFEGENILDTNRYIEGGNGRKW